MIVDQGMEKVVREMKEKKYEREVQTSQMMGSLSVQDGIKNAEG